MNSYDQILKLLKNERKPAAIVDLEAFDANLKTVQKLFEGTSFKLRVASKSFRAPALMRRVLDAAPCFQGIMCYSAEEAGKLFEQGLTDLLIAYPTVQNSDLEILKQIHEKGAKVSLVVDCEDHLKILDQAMRGIQKPFSLILEVDMSWRPMGSLHVGVRRSPIRTVDQTVEFFKKAKNYSHLNLIGIMGYEAQVAGLQDVNPFKKSLSPILKTIRKRSQKAVFRLRKEISEALQQEGFSLQIFNGGGSGSLNWTMKEPWLTEITIGSGILCSHLFNYYSNIQFQPALFFALQVVRASDPGYVTCQGGGYIASGEPGWDKVPVPFYPNGLKLVSTEGCGEVQTPLLVGNQKFELGESILFRPAKAGEPSERFKDYWIYSEGVLLQKIKTYRGLGWCFF